MVGRHGLGPGCRAHRGQLLRVWCWRSPGGSAAAAEACGVCAVSLQEARAGRRVGGVGSQGISGQSEVAARVTGSTDLVSPARDHLGGDPSQGSAVPTSPSPLETVPVTPVPSGLTVKSVLLALPRGRCPCWA